MTRPVRIIAGLVAAFFVGLAAILMITRSDAEPEIEAGSSAASVAARPDSHRLTTVPDAKATFVEFLDFECESCAAVHPAIEELRAEYGDRVEFVVRYFPMPGHFNGERAARAVEAAAQQGKFEQMYQVMFETQPQWGEKRVPMDDVFRGFAADLGLDLDAFDAAYNDPATATRIQADIADGKSLGARGTPTFFINGKMIEPTSYEDLTNEFDAALR